MSAAESPWIPDGDYLLALPKGFTLLNPNGVNHLLLDEEGHWWHLQRTGRNRRLTAGEAAQLRPSEVGQIITLTLVNAMRQLGVIPDTDAAPADGPDRRRHAGILRSVDDLAKGVQEMILVYAARAGHRPRMGAR